MVLRLSDVASDFPQTLKMSLNGKGGDTQEDSMDGDSAARAAAASVAMAGT